MTKESAARALSQIATQMFGSSAGFEVFLEPGGRSMFAPEWQGKVVTKSGSYYAEVSSQGEGASSVTLNGMQYSVSH